MSPILAVRGAEDQRELALGVMRRGPDGKWGWKMDPAYIRQRVEHGAPARPPLWPALQALPARPWWCGAPKATCSPRRRRCAWSTYCRAASWSGCPASGCADPGRAGGAGRPRPLPRQPARGPAIAPLTLPLRGSLPLPAPRREGFRGVLPRPACGAGRGEGPVGSSRTSRSSPGCGWSASVPSRPATW